MDNILNGHTLAITVTDTRNYDLVSVTDMNGCPVYSNFEPGAVVQVLNENFVIDCQVLAPATGLATLAFPRASRSSMKIRIGISDNSRIRIASSKHKRNWEKKGESGG